MAKLPKLRYGNMNYYRKLEQDLKAEEEANPRLAELAERVDTATSGRDYIDGVSRHHKLPCTIKNCPWHNQTS